MPRLSLGRTEVVEQVIAELLELDTSQVVAGSLRIDLTSDRGRVTWSGVMDVSSDFLDLVYAEVQAREAGATRRE